MEKHSLVYVVDNFTLEIRVGFIVCSTSNEYTVDAFNRVLKFNKRNCKSNEGMSYFSIYKDKDNIPDNLKIKLENVLEVFYE